MDELQVSATENKPVYRVSAAGLDPRDVRLIEIVFKHSQYNPFGFVLDARLDPEAVDILIVNPAESEGLRAVARVRTVGRQVPVISAVPRGAPSTGRHAISIDRLTLQLLPILNRVVELELGGSQVPVEQEAGMRPAAAQQAPLASAAAPVMPQAQPVQSQGAQSQLARVPSAQPQAAQSRPMAPQVESGAQALRPSVSQSPEVLPQPMAQQAHPPQPAAAASSMAVAPQAPVGATPPSSPSFAQPSAPSGDARPSSPAAPLPSPLSPSSSLQFPAAPAGSVQASAPGTPANPLHLDLPTRDFLRRAADKSREGDQLREQAARTRWQHDVGLPADASPPGLQWMLRKPDSGLPATPTTPPLDVSSARSPQAPPLPEPRSPLPVGLADLQLPDLNLPDLRLPDRAPPFAGASGLSENQGTVAGQVAPSSGARAAPGMPAGHVPAATSPAGAGTVQAAAPAPLVAAPVVAPAASTASSALGGLATAVAAAAAPAAPVAPVAPAASSTAASAVSPGASAAASAAASPAATAPLPAWARDPLPAAARQGGGPSASLLSSPAPASAGPGTGAASNLVALPLNTEVPPARIRVLVVDDSPTVRQQLARAFARMAIICDAAASAAEALQRLAERHFDLVLVDVVMPDVDGYKLTRQIRRKHRGTPVIILTSRSSPFDLARGALAGCHTYLVKPVPLKQLEAAVVKLLRKSLAIDDLTGMVRLSSDAPAKASRAADASEAPTPRSPRSAGE